jgi:hypothetical protein
MQRLLESDFELVFFPGAVDAEPTTGRVCGSKLALDLTVGCVASLLCR